MRSRRFQQVDVFTESPYLGNPLAVVLDGDGLSTEQMQHFAAWTQLSETTFVLPPTHADADYRVRIFTPGAELPFAGHPTLGTCAAWRHTGGRPRDPDLIVQECAVGLVRIRREAATTSAAASPDSGAEPRYAFAAPPLQRSTISAELLADVCAALGLRTSDVHAAQLLDNGPQWLGLLLDSPEAVLALEPDHPALKRLGVKVGVVGISGYGIFPQTDRPGSAPSLGLIARSSREARAFGSSTSTSTPMPTPTTADTATAAGTGEVLVEVRAFAAPVGINEDPVTGSLNASLAQWLIPEGHLPDHYVATQGTRLNRRGQVRIARDAAGQVWVGGGVVVCVDGTVIV
jgi:PhzF family phenazine biosynthesis protein